MRSCCCGCCRRRVGEGAGGTAVELDVAVRRTDDVGEAWRSNEDSGTGREGKEVEKHEVRGRECFLG